MILENIPAGRHLGAAAALVFALSFTAGAQSAASPSAARTQTATPAAKALPTADQVLDHYLQGSGGPVAWKKLTSRVSKGTIDIPAMNLSGVIEVHEKAPNQMIATVTIGGGNFVQAFDGKTAWSNDPQNGLRELSDGEFEETQRDADFYRPLDMKTLYKKFTVVGAEKIGDHDTYVVEAVGQEGVDPEKMYFDAQTGLPVRDVSQRHTPDGVSPIQEDFADYRNVDGIKLPFSVKQTAGGNEFTVTFTEIQQNVEMDDTQFAKPAAQ
jgi:hypothetical protein